MVESSDGYRSATDERQRTGTGATAPRQAHTDFQLSLDGRDRAMPHPVHRGDPVKAGARAIIMHPRPPAIGVSGRLV